MKQAKEIIFKLYRSVNNGDVNACVDLFTDDAVLIHPDIEVLDPNLSSPFKGKQAIRRFFINQSKRDFILESLNIIREGDKAASEWVDRWTTPEGNRHELYGVDIYEFDGNLIKRCRIYCDPSKVREP